MERLTTNDPQGNVETAHNLFYAKDTEAWVRGGGAAPDYADITLYDFIRQIVQSLGPMNIDASVPDEELGEEMCEVLLDGTGTIEGLVATLYTAAWAFADLRNRLAAYEDTGLEPDEITDFLPTLKEWRQNMGALRHVHELVTAEAEGRLVVLPCKTVFEPTWDAGKDCDLVCPASIDGVGCCSLCEKAELFVRERPCKQDDIDRLGKTVFRTREEAETKLMERGE